MTEATQQLEGNEVLSDMFKRAFLKMAPCKTVPFSGIEAEIIRLAADHIPFVDKKAKKPKS